MTNGATMLAQLRKTAEAFGARAFGIADLERVRAEPVAALERVPDYCVRAVVAGIRLSDAVLDQIEDQPTPLYFHHYRQANYQLDRMAFALAADLQEGGWRSLAVPASQIVARDPMRGMVSHRRLGRAAGIGHIGRSGLLVHPLYGARMRYVSVLTDAALPASDPCTADCGSCRACLARCPAGAIGERVEDFDLAACTRKLTEFTRIPFVGQHICGVCVRACAGRPAAVAAQSGDERKP
jgi:epoxyqueuosine reductase